MDISKVKLRCSLAWLASVVQNEAEGQTETVKQLLMSPHEPSHELRSEVVSLLTDPNLYLSVYGVLFPGEGIEGGSYWPLIHGLARRGVYVLEDSDVAVNHSVLAQNNPFREGSHLALLDGLMTAYASSIVTVERVVRAVREISQFNPSKELPLGVEDALLLWLNKVSQAVCGKQNERVTQMLQDPDARQRRRNRLKLMGEEDPSIPFITDLGSVSDGQCLGAVLLHYASKATKWSDFDFSTKPLSQTQCLHNLNKARELCSTHLPISAFHLTPEDLLKFGRSDLLKTNILALLAYLFWCFEIRESPSKLTNRSSTSIGTKISNGNCHQNGQSKGRETLQNSLSNKRSLFRQEQPKTRAVPARLSLSSYSTSDLLSEHRRIPTTHQSYRLSSFSTSALLESTPAPSTQTGGHLASGGTVFNPPLRTSLTASQAAALAGFNYAKQAKVPTANGRQQQQEMITASTENLHIREQMMSEKLARTRRQPVRHNASLSSSSNSASTSSLQAELSTSGTADVSGNCTESWHPSSNENTHTGLQLSALQRTVNLSQTALNGTAKTAFSCYKQSEPGVPLQFSSHPPKRSVQFYLEKSTVDEEMGVKRSFTLDKHHTMASASAAGLPIISAAQRKKASVIESEPEPTTKPPISNGLSSSERKSPSVSSSTSSGSSTPTIIHLKLYPRAVAFDEVPVPPEIIDLRQQLREREMEIRKQQALLEKQLLLEKQKFHQKVFLAVVQKSQKPDGLPLSSETSVMATKSLVPQFQKKHTQLNRDEATSASLVASSSSEHSLKYEASKAPSQEPTTQMRQQNGHEITPLLPPHIDPTPSSKNPRMVLPEATTSWSSICSTGKKPAQYPSGPLQQFPFSPILSAKPAANPALPPPENPWVTGAQNKAEAQSQSGVLNQRKLSHENLMKRQQQVKVRLEERERARKTTVEKRRKEQALQRTLQELHPQDENCETALETTEDGSHTLHFKLSSQAREKPPYYPDTTASADPHSKSSFLTHNGPDCYIRPRIKSNRKLIRNAICHVCLAGDANMSMKQRALAELDSSPASHFFILFRDTIGFKFRALYSYTPETSHVTKLFGSGPRVIKEHMVSHLYKYNCGAKEFKEIQTKSFSISVGALTIQNDYWLAGKKSKPPSGAFK